MYYVCYGHRERLQVIDVFESQVKLDAFGAKLMPILQDVVLRPSQQYSRSTTSSKGNRLSSRNRGIS